MSNWVTVGEALSLARRGYPWLQERVGDGRIRRRYAHVYGRQRARYHAGDVLRESGGVVARKRQSPPEGRRARPRAQVGDIVRVDRGNSRGAKIAPTKGRVVEVYERFAVVLFPQGYREAWDHCDLAPVREGRRRAG